MQAYGSAFARLGFTLRSGAAPGADTAFETGCFSAMGKKEIYLPWKNFNDHDSTYYYIPQEVLDIAGDVYGSRWRYLKRPVKLLMARNIYQVLGLTLDVPSNFVVCWTPDGAVNRSQRIKETGGTGQAIACASDNNVPVFNLYNKGCEQDLWDFVNQLTE